MLLSLFQYNWRQVEKFFLAFLNGNKKVIKDILQYYGADVPTREEGTEDYSGFPTMRNSNVFYLSLVFE